MDKASRYWTLVRIDATGRRKVETIDLLKVFFSQQFPETNGAEVQDIAIQRRLFDWLRQGEQAPDCNNYMDLAEGCLRCFISHQIDEVCRQLAKQFGKEHGFTCEELFVFVPNDVSVLNLRSLSNSGGKYQSLATDILRTFDPQRSSLAAWTTKLVKHYPELNAFLLQRGVYMVSDWAILNDTTPKQLQRIGAEMYGLTAMEIQQACMLIESYHLVYRRDRLKFRQAGGGRRCLPPTQQQLEQIAQIYHSKIHRMFPTQEILTRLQDVAEQLRQYRIYIRGGCPPTESLPVNFAGEDNLPSPNGDDLDEENEQAEFLQIYRRFFLVSLEQAVKKAISDRVTRLQRNKNSTERKFLLALHSFHCEGKSMGEIAALVGLEAQYQVTRLLKLKEFRADIRQRMLESLRTCVLETATAYVDPERLGKLDVQLEVALNEQIDRVIKAAADEASCSQKPDLKSLLAQKLCEYLDSIKD